MASRGTLLSILLVAFALMAMCLMEGVQSSAPSSFVRRRLIGHPQGAGAATAATCLPACVTSALPTCCPDKLFPLLDGYCANLQIDPLNCGTCGKICGLEGLLTTVCCEGSCVTNLSLLSDPKNCGKCGNVCSPKGTTPATCHLGLCNYAT